MRLRRQLLLLSLLTLILPWAGCQYLQEVDRALRAGQSSALAATAQAVAARLGAEPRLLLDSNLSQRGDAPREEQLYVHPLDGGVIVDGYTGDWQQLGLGKRHFQHDSNAAFAASIQTAGTPETLYLLVQVEDPTLSYHNPSAGALASGDHLVLASGRSMGASRYYVISASAPGAVTVKTRDALGRELREHRIRGYWQETQAGYNIELSLPTSLVGSSLGWAVVSKDPAQAPALVGSLSENALLAGQARDPGLLPPVTGQLIYTRPELSEALQIFVQPGLKLSVIDSSGWRLAGAGNIESQTQPQDRAHWLLRLLYDAVLARQLPSYPELADGRSANPAVDRALEGETDSFWQARGQHRLGSAATPIRIAPEDADAVENLTLGAVLVEQSSDHLQALTESAFTRLIVTGFLAIMALALILLGYASWLSWRIGRLNLAVSSAFNRDGQLDTAAPMPASAARDEIGDLSRSYGQLFERLQGYTDYLKTLASKLSHELRTPLAVVRSSLDNLDHQALSAEARIYSARARQGAERLSSLVSAMSQVGRIEASIARAEREPVALDQLLRELTSAYQDTYPGHLISCSIETPIPAEAYRLYLAPELIVQMLDKLMENAVDFCPPQGRIDLRLKANPNSGNPEIELINQGPLLPQAMQAQLFDSLVSVRSQSSTGSHLGLGLYIARLIALFHGGELKARNLADGSGVCFGIEFKGANSMAENGPATPING